jgi:hypothetical protein
MNILLLFFPLAGMAAHDWALPSPKRSEELSKETESSVL